KNDLPLGGVILVVGQDRFAVIEGEDARSSRSQYFREAAGARAGFQNPLTFEIGRPAGGLEEAIAAVGCPVIAVELGFGVDLPLQAEVGRIVSAADEAGDEIHDRVI